MAEGSLLTPSMFVQGSEGNLCCVWLSEPVLFEMQSDPRLHCLFFRTAFRHCYPWMAAARDVDKVWKASLQDSGLVSQDSLAPT